MASPTVDRRFGLVGNMALKAPVAAVATTNITLSGQQSIDGVALLAVNAAGVADRVLVTGQTDATQNGIYDVSLNAWSRSADANGPYDFAPGTQVLVSGGTINVRTVWCLTTTLPITIGTSALTWQLAIGSSLGNFLQAGAGAVARTFTSKVRELVASVKDFGAVGDGVTDDYAAIRAALDAVPVGGTVFFPLGTYVCSQTINLKKRVNMVGELSGHDGVVAGTALRFAAGKTGIIVNTFTTRDYVTEASTTSAAGSVIEGLYLSQSGYAGPTAAIGDYNATDSKFITYSYITTPPGAGSSVLGLLSRATATVSSVSAAAWAMGITPIAGTFALAETITGGTSAATATVAYRGSATYPSIAFITTTGTFVVGETITGGTSGATATVASISANVFFRVVTLTGITGAFQAKEPLDLSGKTGDGIFLRARATIRNCVVELFPWCGITAVNGNVGYGPYAASLVGNANCFRIEGCTTNSNGLHGIHLMGSDANAGKVDACSATGNGGYGICDQSFLGIEVCGSPHTSINNLGPLFTSATSVITGLYTEGNFLATPYPGGQVESSGTATFLPALFGTDFQPTTSNVGTVDRQHTVFRRGHIETKGFKYRATSANNIDAKLWLTNQDDTNTVNGADVLIVQGAAGANTGGVISFERISGFNPNPSNTTTAYTGLPNAKIAGLSDGGLGGFLRLRMANASGVITSGVDVRFNELRPTTDAGAGLGSASFRWTQLFATTTTISTSDEREKESIQAIEAAALRAWAKVEYCQFKFRDAAVEKGDGARWHFGVIAQRVKEAFEAESLDPFAYGVLCYDEFPDVFEPICAERDVVVDGVVQMVEDGSRPRREVYDTGERRLVSPAGNRYGIRYEEALVLECALMRNRLERLESAPLRGGDAPR